MREVNLTDAEVAGRVLVTMAVNTNGVLDLKLTKFTYKGEDHGDWMIRVRPITKRRSRAKN